MNLLNKLLANSDGITPPLNEMSSVPDTGTYTTFMKRLGRCLHNEHMLSAQEVHAVICAVDFAHDHSKTQPFIEKYGTLAADVLQDAVISPENKDAEVPPMP